LAGQNFRGFSISISSILMSDVNALIFATRPQMPLPDRTAEQIFIVVEQFETDIAERVRTAQQDVTVSPLIVWQAKVEYFNISMSPSIKFDLQLPHCLPCSRA